MALDKSFKDVGVKTEPGKTGGKKTNRSEVPIGIKTPVEIDSTGGSLFKMHTDIQDQIADNLKNLLATNHGERVIQYDYGANLRELVTEFSGREDFDSEAMLRINTAIKKFMPFVTPVGFESSPNFEENEYLGIIDIRVAYSVPSLQIEEDIVEVRLAVV